MAQTPQKSVQIFGIAKSQATRAAEDARKKDIADQRAAELKASQDITEANKYRMGITTPRGPGGFQGTAPGGRDEYGNFFTPGVQSV